MQTGKWCLNSSDPRSLWETNTSRKTVHTRCLLFINTSSVLKGKHYCKRIAVLYRNISNIHLCKCTTLQSAVTLHTARRRVYLNCLVRSCLDVANAIPRFKLEGIQRWCYQYYTSVHCLIFINFLCNGNYCCSAGCK